MNRRPRPARAVARRVVPLAVAALGVLVATTLLPAAPSPATPGVGGNPWSATTTSVTTTSTTGRPACEPSPFTAEFDAALRRRWPGQRFTASVYDRRTGCWYDYRPDLRITTASLLKAEILAGLLLRAQREGRGISRWEHDRIVPMIRASADPPTQELWYSLGAVEGMRRVDAAFGLTQTVPTRPWGLTTTSARDRTALMRQLVFGDYGPLTAASRATARNYLLDVLPSQQWGISAGVPPGTRVPLKNGFFSSQCCRWRLNSSGVVETAGGGYAITILSDHWPNERSGIEGVEYVSRAIAARLAGPFGPFATQGAFLDRQQADLLGRRPTYAELNAAVATTGWDYRRAGSVIGPLLSRSEWDRVGPPVIRLYLGGLGRNPDGASFALREWQLRTGRITTREIARYIAESDEFSRGLDLTDHEAFVTEVVRRAVGRAPTEHERTAWAERLALGWVHRGDVLLHYTESNESRWLRHHATIVAGVYLAMLERAPEPTAVTYWVERLRAGSSAAALAGGVALSPEYRARVA